MVYREIKKALSSANLFARQYMDYEKYVGDGVELEVLDFWKKEAQKQHYRLISTGSEEADYMLDLIKEIEDSIESWILSIKLNDKSLYRKVWQII